MRTIIAGSRTITDYSLVEQAVQESGFRITKVISGCAKGVDKLGERWALENGKAVERYPADWDTYGKAAGPIRNRQMAEVADAVIAVTTGSPGTRHMISVAKELGLKLYVKEVRK